MIPINILYKNDCSTMNFTTIQYQSHIIEKFEDKTYEWPPITQLNDLHEHYFDTDEFNNINDFNILFIKHYISQISNKNDTINELTNISNNYGKINSTLIENKITNYIETCQQITYHCQKATINIHKTLMDNFIHNSYTIETSIRKMKSLLELINTSHQTYVNTIKQIEKHELITTLSSSNENNHTEIINSFINMITLLIELIKHLNKLNQEENGMSYIPNPKEKLKQKQKCNIV